MSEEVSLKVAAPQNQELDANESRSKTNTHTPGKGRCTWCTAIALRFAARQAGAPRDAGRTCPLLLPPSKRRFRQQRPSAHVRTYLRVSFSTMSRVAVLHRFASLQNSSRAAFAAASPSRPTSLDPLPAGTLTA